MLERITDLSVKQRALMVVLGVAVLISGFWAVPRLPVDAVPDVTNVQVVVLTEAGGLSAEEMERFVTFPVEMAMTGLPGLTELRSVTRGGLSAVTIVFEEGVDVWFARQLVTERVREVEADIPPEFGRPQLAPVSTGLGEIYQFVLRSEQRSSMELRSMLQWEISPRLRSVPGVIEVNAMGGAAKEFQVVLDPRRLAAYGLTLGQVLESLERGNASVGGGWIERGPEQYVIRGEGLLRDVAEIGSVVVSADDDGTPILVRQLGEVREGAALPYGVVTQNGEGEAVTGIVLMLIGQNSREVVSRVHEEMARIRAELPDDVEVDVVYDRASFIERTLETVATNLVEGLVLVAIVILVFLRSWRAALLVTLGIPFAMILAVWGMIALGVDGSLMSLGAIDFGLLVDGPIVMVEAVMARLAIEDLSKRSRTETIGDAIRQVARPVAFSVLIILLVYVPLLSLEGTEGKMFRPMATTMALALGGSVVFALLVFPAGAALFLKGGGHHHGGFLGWLEGRYTTLVDRAIRARGPLVGLAVVLLVCTIPIGGSLGADFVPRIDEGDIVVAIRRIPSLGLSEARRLDLEVERVLARFPEVVSQIGMTGRSEVATDPVGMDNTDILVRLRPKDEWTTAHDLDSLGEAMKTAIESEVPSTFVSISQPIEDRTNEMISGSRADVAILLFGDDLERMSSIGRRIGAVLRSVPGAGDVRVERALGMPMLLVRPDRTRLARYGMRSEEVLAAVEASRQGRRVGHVFEGQRRMELRVLLPPIEQSLEGFRALPVGTSDGALVPIGQVASVVEADGPSQISRQSLRRRLRIEVNIRGRDLISFVDDARAAVARDIELPDGYDLEWGGQFENFQRASARLGMVVPIALAIIFAMLFFAFGDVRYALAVFSGVPFALIGGVAALAARGMPFSIPAAVGFIALCGIAVLNGVVMASEVKRRIEGGASVEDAIRSGAIAVLRAVLLTATVAAIGFLPMAISGSAGSEVQRPLATAVMGGVVSSTLLGLFVLPALLSYALRSTSESATSEGPYRDPS
ncbi:efflux RND transporter permease subunit [Sandaracinus amylolyticus]|uniref:Cobalt-zinc-cadmium resistance protein CzcA n=1 Tax=Sandaracinus amylolyticus TaxID=927083 RepID=A0A0F6VYU5_9BACT|nr:CusA/CzcA family heavy metal efflux RND transporter [Sandaracinus amylolyticus]AKF02927.1 Cobalt-zinc-cadmium resistance protein CzcA [Sandaracinus amylolyticus]